MKIIKLLKFAAGMIPSAATAGVEWYLNYEEEYINSKPVKPGVERRNSYVREKDGKYKKTYNDPRDAKEEAIKNMLKTGESFKAYSLKDGKYRVGHGEDKDNTPFVALGKFKRTISNIIGFEKK